MSKQVNALRIPPRRLVLVGSVLVDILLYVDRLPDRGGDAIAQQAILTTGGGFNVLVGATRLGLPAAYAGRVGDGPMGSRVMADLAAAGIPLVLPRVAGEDTGFDVGLVESDAERTFVTAPGAESRLCLADLNAIPLRAGDAVYVSGYDLCYPVSGAALGAWLPALPSSYLLVIDPGPLVGLIPPERLAPVLARCDILSLNARETSILSGLAGIVEGAQALASRIAPGGCVVARAGAQGCWLVSAGREPLHIPARAVHAVDSTGAGDAHVAAMLARLAFGESLAAAARAANIAASVVVEHAGPATGPTARELEELLDISLPDTSLWTKEEPPRGPAQDPRYPASPSPGPYGGSGGVIPPEPP
jgi:sugar/nucleoside kinase (ribokinase family)